MRITVTGSAGLIGSEIVPLLESRGHAVVRYDYALDRSDDVVNSARLAKAAWESDVVLHLAAISRVEQAERDPCKAFAVNVQGVYNALNAARKTNAALVFASSREVCGDRHVPFSDETPRPRNVYAHTKLAGESLVSSYRWGTVVRLSNVYGGVGDHSTRVIPAWMRAARSRGELRVDDPNALLDFTWVGDVAGALLRICEGAGQQNVERSPIEIATGTRVRLACAAQLVIRCWQAGHVVIGSRNDRYASVFVADTSAIDKLGIRPQTMLAEGLELYRRRIEAA